MQNRNGLGEEFKGLEHRPCLLEAWFDLGYCMVPCVLPGVTPNMNQEELVGKTFYVRGAMLVILCVCHPLAIAKTWSLLHR